MTDLPARSASLAPFFTPHGVALIGASRDPGKLSYGVLSNLINPETGYKGPIYPVNPKADEILGLRCYPDISAVPDPVELAILLLPAGLVGGVIEDCGKRGIKAAVIISGGFREVGPEGVARELQAVEIAQRYGMRLMGPNGIGVIDTHTPLNTTFVRGTPARGEIAFLSQSGALCGGVIDWVIGRGIGFSRLLSVGNEADVNETDAIPFLAADEESRVITLYLEDIKGGRRFVDALRDATSKKPVIAIKTGRTASGQAATASHTGALAGAHAPFRAACLQTGVIEVESIETMFNGALALAYQPLLSGKRIAILTNAGGPAALAADSMEKAGLKLAHSSPDIQAALRKLLMHDAQVAGPIDMLGGASAQDYRHALELALADPQNDGVLAINVPTALVDPVDVIQALSEVSQSNAFGKPLLVCLMGEYSLADAFKAAHKARLPAYTFPEDAIAAFGILSRRSSWVSNPHPVPVPPAGVDFQLAQTLLERALQAGRKSIDAAEGRAILQAVGIAVAEDQLATSPEEAAQFAEKIGFPVVLKLASPDILHKTDVGGVIFGINDGAAASKGYQTILNRAHEAYPQAHIRGVQVQKMISGGQEVILGVKRDPTFGPMVMFGLGGVYVEALADVSFRLAPVSRQDAEDMFTEVRSAKILSGLRGAPPSDKEALLDAIQRVSWLAAHCENIQELDINPLLVLPEGEGALAVDTRILLT